MASKGFFFPGNVIRSNFEFHRITYIILYSLLKGCRAESINSPSSRMSMQHNARVKENTSSSSSSLRENSIFNRPSWACFNTPRYTSKILQPDYEAWIRPGFISWIFVSFRERNGTFEPVLFFSAPVTFIEIYGTIYAENSYIRRVFALLEFRMSADACERGYIKVIFNCTVDFWLFVCSLLIIDP